VLMPVPATATPLGGTFELTCSWLCWLRMIVLTGRDWMAPRAGMTVLACAACDNIPSPACAACSSMFQVLPVPATTHADILALVHAV
jgi:hypothetical protein